jgi:ApbE superfamily uncharacterized protein (UPF0280 family)
MRQTKALAADYFAEVPQLVVSDSPMAYLANEATVARSAASAVEKPALAPAFAAAGLVKPTWIS